MSTRAQLSETLNRLLPGEQWKRVREGILAAASYSGQRTDQLRQNIDEANRLKTGLLVNGNVDFTSTTNADLSGYAWVIDFEIQQQTATESVTVDAPDADFPRPDIFVGLADGSIEYRAGTIDEEGNVQDPSYNPATEVLLAAVTRNPDTSNDVSDESASPSDFVSKSATGTEIMQGSLAIGSLSDPDNPSNLIQVDTNGKIIIVRADRYGSFATRNLAVGFSRLARINTVVSGGPAIRDYQFKLDILATLDGDVTQRGELYCALINDGTGTYVSSVLEVTGDLNPDVFKLVKVSATAYDLFYEHLDTKAILIYRPFALGPADRYIFYRRETILASLPAGDQYSFSEAGGGTSLDADIVDALDAANLPDAGNPFATMDDIPIIPEDFIDLLDVPSAYTGQGGKKVKVKADETGLEFVDDTGGGGADPNAVHYNAADGKSETEQRQARTNIGVTSSIAQHISTSGTLNNVVRNSAFIYFSAATQITGFSAGFLGDELIIYNFSSNNIELIKESLLSSSGNRIGSEEIIPPRCFQTLKYANLKWNVIGSPFYHEPGSGEILRFLPTLFGNMTSPAAGIIFGSRGRTAGTSQKCVQHQAYDGTEIFYLDNSGKGYFRRIVMAGGFGNTSIVFNGFRANSSSGTLGAFALENNSGTLIHNFLCDGTYRHSRSNGVDKSIRRDEQRLYYLVSITTSGSIADQALTDGIFNYRFTSATSISGFANGEIGRTIDIDNDSGSNLTLQHENAGSIAANRINLIGAADLIIPTKGKVTLKYCTGSRWELVSKNF